MHWWHILLLILICLSVAALGLVWLCAYTAKKVLHPVSKRKALYLWPDEYKMPNIKCLTIMSILLRKTR